MRWLHQEPSKNFKTQHASRNERCSKCMYVMPFQIWVLRPPRRTYNQSGEDNGCDGVAHLRRVTVQQLGLQGSQRLNPESPLQRAPRVSIVLQWMSAGSILLCVAVSSALPRGIAFVDPWVGCSWFIGCTYGPECPECARDETEPHQTVPSTFVRGLNVRRPAQWPEFLRQPNMLFPDAYVIHVYNSSDPQKSRTLLFEPRRTE